MNPGDMIVISVPVMDGRGNVPVFEINPIENAVKERAWLSRGTLLEHQDKPMPSIIERMYETDVALVIQSLFGFAFISVKNRYGWVAESMIKIAP